MSTPAIYMMLYNVHQTLIGYVAHLIRPDCFKFELKCMTFRDTEQLKGND